MMKRIGPQKLSDSGAPERGFTLIEVMTSVALTVLLMIGVIEIFKMSADTASQTQQASDAFEMGRGVMAQLESDLSQFAPEGYLWVRCQEMDPTFWVSTSSATAGQGLVPQPTEALAAKTTTGRYRFDDLAFTIALSAPTTARLVTSTGAVMMHSSDFSGCAAGGQVIYTFGTRNFPPVSDSVSPIMESPYLGTKNNSDQRGVVLVRKLYLDGNGSGTAPSGLPLLGGTSATFYAGQFSAGPTYPGMAPWLVGTTPVIRPTGSVANNYALGQPTCMASMLTEPSASGGLGWVLTPKCRIAPASFYYSMFGVGYPGAAPTTLIKDTAYEYTQPMINVPDSSLAGTLTANQDPNLGTKLSELDNIICDRVSEFFVEVWNGKEWVPNNPTMQGKGSTSYTYTTTNLPLPLFIPSASNDCLPSASVTSSGGGWSVNLPGLGAFLPTGAYAWYANVGGANYPIATDSGLALGNVSLLRDNMLWLGTAANPLNRYEAVNIGTAQAADLPPRSLPSMIRVTLVVHPHSDRTLLKNESYGAIYYPPTPTGTPILRVQGVVFREIFKLSGTNH